MKTLQELQKIALELHIDISDCQDIDCIKKRINEATAVAAEELRKEYEKEIKEDKIKKNDYIKNSTENFHVYRFSETGSDFSWLGQLFPFDHSHPNFLLLHQL